MKELKEFIEDGITISKTNSGYEVFTIKTQKFNINSLDELTPESFMTAIESQRKLTELQNQIYTASGLP
jgi:hypothetical protein